MKKQLFCILFLPCALTSGAQIKGALIVGPHGASVTPAFTQFPDTVARTTTQKAGIHIGFIADIPLSRKLYLQPGLIYSAKGSKEQQAFDSTSRIRTAVTALNVNYIDAPFNLVFKLPLKGKTKFMIGAGPQASLFYSGNHTHNTLDEFGKYEETKDEDLPVGNGAGKYKVVHVAANALAGLEFGRVFLTANYSQGLTPFYKNETQEFKHKTFGATLGIFLGKLPPEAPVVKDKDGDGVPDEMDECATVAGSALTKGCPDKDGDGVADKDDQCPEIAGTMAYHGCPVPDKDQDGVNDEEDRCPDVAGLSKYHGCPVPDRDKDGINDEEDQCPDQPGTARYKGCPVPDTDKDGINDEEDQCPDQAGTAANKGCPEVSKQVEEKVAFAARRIQFQYQKATLTAETYGVLKEVVTVLKAHPELHITVEGHTTGQSAHDAANLRLSQQRAQAVKAYLVKNGIAADRITAIGYGSSRPLNNSTDPEESAKNRRVELKLSAR